MPMNKNSLFRYDKRRMKIYSSFLPKKEIFFPSTSKHLVFLFRSHRLPHRCYKAYREAKAFILLSYLFPAMLHFKCYNILGTSVEFAHFLIVINHQSRSCQLINFYILSQFVFCKQKQRRYVFITQILGIDHRPPWLFV